MNLPSCLHSDDDTKLEMSTIHWQNVENVGKSQQQKRLVYDFIQLFCSHTALIPDQSNEKRSVYDFIWLFFVHILIIPFFHIY